MNNTPNTPPQTEGSANDTCDINPAPKWAASIDDTLVLSPQRQVHASVLLAQAGVQEGKVLVRDHGGDPDAAIGHAEIIDLSKGNVFYVVAACDAPGKSDCLKPAKLALFLNDRPEETMNPHQTGRTIRELFGLAPDVDLFRDYESPHDELVGLEEPASFERGPVFITKRQHTSLSIVVNSKRFTQANGVKKNMTGREIASFVSDNPHATEVFRIKGAQSEAVPLNTEIHIENCDEFRVIRNNVAGGFETARIQREIQKLKEAGCRVDFIQQPIPAVIYRDVPTRPGYQHLRKTDVLVAVPGGYPGQFIDGGFLPQGSPLLGRVAGSPQHSIQADGCTWQLVSYHPHNGGGGPPWNKDRHGFHTYFDEVLCWIHRANN
ncbi:MAG: hypothetical protein JWM16_1725 [Verrucomicrobiales bacterium]|nr:hypothetical protein [Verrucomicrobiales bacterium]